MSSFDDQRNIVIGILANIDEARSRLDATLHKSINVNPVMAEIAKLERKLAVALTSMVDHMLDQYEARVVLYPRKKHDPA
jgi:hypothetical protein